MPQVAIGIAISIVTFCVGKAYQRIFGEKLPERLKSATHGLRFNTRSTEETIRIIYGQLRVGGNDVYIRSTGSNNQILWIVQCLGEGKLDSIVKSDGVDQVYLDDKIYTDYGGNVYYYFHQGTSDQTVDTNLNSASSEWVDTLPYTSYVVWKLVYNENYFQGPPKKTIEIKGKHVYDFRNDITIYSNNPVLCLYDYLTNTRYGMGLDSSILDSSSWISAANYCDTKGFELNMAIMEESKAHDVIDNILIHFRGTMVWYDGKFYLRYSDLNYESSSMALTDSHIVQDDSGIAQIRVNEPSMFEKPDGIRVSYNDKTQGYVTNSVVIGDSNGMIENLDLPGCTDREMASNLGNYYLERRQLNRNINGLFRDDALQLEPHDVVTLTSDALSISNQVMRVENAEIQPNGLINLNLLYENLNLYNDDYDLLSETTYSCTLPNFQDSPPEPSSWSVSEETYYYRLRTFTRIKVSYDFSPDYPWLRHVEIWLSFDNSTWNHLFNVATDNFIVENVEEGTTYYLKLVTVSIWGVKNDGLVLSKLITGDTDPPESLASLTASVNENTINLWALKLTDPDIEGYEFRLGPTWSGAIHLATLDSPNLSLKGAKPGEHTFWCNTLGNNELYGDTPRSAGASLIDPPDGWTVVGGDTQTQDYL